MASISLAQLQGLFRPAQMPGGADINGDGALDKPELAKASLNLLGQNNPTAQTEGRLLATFVQGGKDGKGLLPDYNGDQALSFNELAKFAGNSGVIGPQNFQNTFGARYQSGGSSLNVQGLQHIAEGNLNKYNNVDPNTLGSLGIYGRPAYGGNQNGYGNGGFMPQLFQLASGIFGMLGHYLGR